MTSEQIKNIQLSRLKRMRIKLTNFESDAYKANRLSRQFCKFCEYVEDGMGFSAMTVRKCDICGKEELYGSSYTDCLCEDCAKENKLCKHCGAEID